MSAASGDAATIDGIVRGAGGVPIEGARVMITRAPASFPDIAALTQGDGRFSLPTAGSGEHEIVVVADGYDEAHLAVDSRDPPVSLEIDLSPPR